MNRFTEREVEVLKSLADGLVYKEICKKLFIANGTLYSHMSNIRNKLKVNQKHQIVAWYWKELIRREKF